MWCWRICGGGFRIGRGLLARLRVTLAAALGVALTACGPAPAPAVRVVISQHVRDSLEHALATRFAADSIAGLGMRAARTHVPLNAPAIVLVAPFAESERGVAFPFTQGHATAVRLRALVDSARVSVLERAGHMLVFEPQPANLVMPQITRDDLGYFLVVPGALPWFHRGLESPETIARRMRDLMEAHDGRRGRSKASRPRA